MSDVAQMAGVSVSTVSHVVNQTRPVAPSTELAVRNAMAELGYVPDGARGGVGTRTIGLAMSAFTNPYFAQAFRAVEQVGVEAGYSILVSDTHDDPSIELRAISSLLERRVDAIILAPSAAPHRAIAHVVRRGIPLALIDRFWDDSIDQVGSENLESTARLVDHLAALGHSKIAMMTGLRGLATTVERIDGYRRGMARNDLPVKAELVVSGDSDAGAAAQALRLLVGRRPVPSAVIVGNNQMTVGTLRASRALGIQIPDDLAVVAFDDFEWAEFCEPGMTVIAQDTQEIGEQAVRMILGRLANPNAPTRRLVIGTRFVHRASCGCRP